MIRRTGLISKISSWTPGNLTEVPLEHLWSEWVMNEMTKRYFSDQLFALYFYLNLYITAQSCGHICTIAVRAFTSPYPRRTTQVSSHSIYPARIRFGRLLARRSGSWHCRRRLRMARSSRDWSGYISPILWQLWKKVVSFPLLILSIPSRTSFLFMPFYAVYSLHALKAEKFRLMGIANPKKSIWKFSDYSMLFTTGSKVT